MAIGCWVSKKLEVLLDLAMNLSAVDSVIAFMFINFSLATANLSVTRSMLNQSFDYNIKIFRVEVIYFILDE